ncbi:MAG: L,D-transpeptidase family protein [Cyclobacteriaceae bacterium]
MILTDRNKGYDTDNQRSRSKYKMKVGFENFMIFQVLVFINLTALTSTSFSRQIDQGISFEIRSVLEGAEGQTIHLFENNPIFSLDHLADFYSQRGFREAWIEKGKLTCFAYELRHLIKQSIFDGLVPEDYHLERIEFYFKQFSNNQPSPPSNLELAGLDILLSDAFFLFASHLYKGKIHPEYLISGWDIRTKTSEPEFIAQLREALAAHDIRKHLFSFRPKFPLYGRMRKSLIYFHDKKKEVNSGWKTITYDHSIKPLESHISIPSIRQKLLFWGDLKEYTWLEEALYDSAMLKGVMEFQARNGLLPDGLIGKATIEAINKSPEALIAQVAVNMERLRWIPDTTLNEFILVNIANYSLDYIKNRDTLLHSKVIVGKTYRKTPVFDAQLSYLVFNPTWTVPPTILKNDIIPEVKKNPQYLRSKKMRLLTFSGNEVDPSTIDWDNITSSNFPFMIRQDPGRQNSLGLIKFMFPNKYNVYIHDTPARELFAREDRALSSGCIRIQKPHELAELLLMDQSLWTKDRIGMALNSGREQTVVLKNKIPVILLYLTFWTDSLYVPMVRKDIYKRDDTLYQLLKKPWKSNAPIQKN